MGNKTGSFGVKWMLPHYINVLGEKVPKEELKRLVPYILILHICYQPFLRFTAHQRTLFQFMKKDEPGSFHGLSNLILKTIGIG